MHTNTSAVANSKLTLNAGALPSRRQFLGTTALAGAATLAIGRGVHAAGSDRLRIGLVGCGGRGSGAAMDALSADPNCQIVALGDTFADRLESSLAGMQASEYQDRIDVPKDRQFVGFDAYKQVIDSGIDIVLLCTSPHFRPLHLEYAVQAGKHVFCEKPVAVDAAGVRRVLASCAAAKDKKLNIVSGLCYRYEPAKIATMREIHDGRIGDIRAIHVTYLTGELWHHPRDPKWSEMEYQMRNWLYYTWLSGDHIAEQHIHSLDKGAWALGDEAPVSCVSLGGRQTRTDPRFGHIYDHFSSVFEYKNGMRLFSDCRQQNGCHVDVNDLIYGSKGTANIMKHAITGEQPWKFTGKNENMYRAEHAALFQALQSGDTINNGQYMCQSTLMAIMGRLSAYTGRKVTWEEALNSQENLTPKEYSWGDVSIPHEIAMPGITKIA
ncbi:MAG: Gfo/Idh/MocA family oxidoreductase [Pirellulales bacterium]|nr:Gfo/Idh/MocA family oxidoreductase [Pirellulales bacterium]